MIVVVDVRLLMFTSFHTKGNYKRITSYLMSLLEKYTNKKIKKLIFALDNPMTFRKDLYPEYKAQRREMKKKKSRVEREGLKMFNSHYSKVSDLLVHYGNVLNINGLEADDIASIISFGAKDKDVLFVTADSDWVKFCINKNRAILHVSKHILIPFNKLSNYYEYNYLQKPFLDSFIGVQKENVKGINRLGIKTMLPILKDFGDRLTYDVVLEEVVPIVEDLVKTKKGLSLPNDFESVQDMFNFNYKLFKPFKYGDLSKEQKDVFVAQFNSTPSRDLDKIEQKYQEIFEEFPIILQNEKSFYNLS